MHCCSLGFQLLQYSNVYDKRFIWLVNQIDNISSFHSKINFKSLSNNSIQNNSAGYCCSPVQQNELSRSEQQLSLLISSAVQQYLFSNMRLLLHKQTQNLKRLNTNPVKNIIEALIPVIDNVLSRKCHFEYTQNNSAKTATFYSIAETETLLFSFRISVQVDPQTFLIVYKTTLLRNDQPFRINSSELILNFIHKVAKKAVQIQQQCTLRVDKENGQIQLVKKINYSRLLFASVSQLMKEVELRLKELVLASQRMLHSILFEINQTTKKTEEIKGSRSQHFEKIKRHVYFSCYDIGLSERASEYKHPSEEILKKREKLIRNLLSRDEKKDDDLHDGILFGLNQVRRSGSKKEWRKEFESTFYFQKLLQIPILKTLNSGENIYIYNEIKIEKPEQIITQDLHNTFNSSLKIMPASFTYMLNPTPAKEETKKEFLNKLLLIKGVKTETVKFRNKLFHERSIVKLFSSAYSGYLLKYYQCNQDNFLYKNCLLMDYSPFNVTLFDHLSLRKESLSIESKLNLLAHISNGLRFLAYYKVVHMDLNLNNILVSDGYLPKLIDFGQAYHQEVVENNLKISYSPGFTIPYCSPEVFAQKEFTTCQDMFSFGIIIFRVLLNVLPFFPSDELISIYKNKSYHSRFYFCPEKLRDCCQEQVCFLLLQVINICMRVEADGRPLPIWSTIILKQILTYIYV